MLSDVFQGLQVLPSLPVSAAGATVQPANISRGKPAWLTRRDQ